MKETPKFRKLSYYRNQVFNSNGKTQFLLGPTQIEIGQILSKDHIEDINEYNIYSNYNLLKKIVIFFTSIIKEQLPNDFKYVVGLGQSGTPLAVLLSNELNKDLIIIDEKRYNLPNSRITLPEIKKDEIEGEKVIICDSVLRSGYTLRNHYTIMKSLGIRDIYLITIIFNQSFFNKIITQDLEDLYYLPLMYWNEDFRDKFINFGTTSEIITNLHNNWLDSVRKIKEERFYKDLIKLLRKLKSEASNEVFFNEKLLEKISDILEKLENVKNYNFDSSRYYFETFLDYLYEKKYIISNSLYSNYFNFTEPDNTVSPSPVWLWPLNQNQPLLKGDDSEIQSEKKEDFFLFKVLFSILFENETNYSSFVEKIDLIILNLKEKKVDELFDLFTDYCFKPLNNEADDFEILISKFMYSLFEDLIYSKRYKKSYENIYNVLFLNYAEIWKNIKNFLVNPMEEDLSGLFKEFDKFLNTISSPIYDTSAQFSDHYNIPTDFFDPHKFLENLFILADDFDDWKLISNPVLLKSLCYNIADKIDKILFNKDKKELVNFFVFGTAGTTIGLIIQKILHENYGYSNIIINFIDNKRFKPCAKTIKNTFSGNNNEDPIFIIDSMKKTGFNLYYIMKTLLSMINEKEIKKDNSIYHSVIVDNLIFHHREIDMKIRNQFNYDIIYIYQNIPKENKIIIKEDNIQFKRNIKRWFYTPNYVEKTEFQELENCKICGGELGKIELNYFIKEHKSKYSKWFRESNFTSNIVKYCDECEVLYIIKQDKDSLKELKNKFKLLLIH